jgi:uncharacterized membrane protein YjgN (DUF898 family)
MIRRLTILAIVLTIVLVPLMAIFNLTTNATVTNEVAINQLNGGDEEYIEAQVYNNYKNVLTVAITAIVSMAVVIILVVTAYMVRTILKNLKK